MGGVAILASIVGALAVRTSTDKVEGALYRGVIISGLISAAAFYPITDWLMSDALAFGFGDAGADSVSVTDLWFCALIGIVVTARAVRDHRLLHVDPLPAGADDLAGRRRPATRPTSSRGSRRASSPRRCPRS